MAKKRTIGEVIKGVRLRKDLSVDDIAATCRVTRSRYYQWEQRDYILAKNLPLLAQALGVTEKYLKRVNGARVLAEEPEEPQEPVIAA